VLAEDGFEQLRKFKTTALRGQLIEAIRDSSERVWVAHSQLKGKLLPKPGGCESIAVLFGCGFLLPEKGRN
jgi:hypothetical protein